MSHSIIVIVKIGLAALAAAANTFYILSMVASVRFFGGRSRSKAALKTEGRAAAFTPPVSIMIPLRGADFKAYQNYERLCRQQYPDYQIVFGVQDGNDSAVPIIRQLISKFPERNIDLVISAQSHGQNAKISNLQNMLSAVRHDHIVIVDSDIRVGPEYLKTIIAPLEESAVGLATCLYRAAETPDFGARLEAVGISSEFAAGVLMAWMIEGVRFALGSTMATTRKQLERIGGFPALADYLADDFMLGNLVARSGYEVRLSDHVVETAMQPAGLSGMIRHQMRWARSTRISRPLGYLGLIFTYGTAVATVLTIVDGFSSRSLWLLAVTLIVRMSMAILIGVYWLGDRILLRNLWLVPIRDLLSFSIWVLSWVGRRVEWRGRFFEVAKDGKMRQEVSSF